MQLLNLIDWALDKIIGPSVAAIGLFLAISFVTGIIARSFLGIAMFGLEELILLAVIWFYMMGAVLASKERSHLQADFISVMFKNEIIVLVFRIMATVISIIMAILFTMWSYDLMQWGFARGKATPVFSIPMYTSQISLFVAAVLMSLYLLRDLVNDVKGLVNCMNEKKTVMQR